MRARLLLAVVLLALLPAAPAVAGDTFTSVRRVEAPRTDTRVWDRLAQCESGGRWQINTGNGYYGGLQFSAGTWRAYGGGKFASYAHRASRLEQITIAKRVRAGQGWGAWPSCSSRLGLR